MITKIFSREEKPCEGASYKHGQRMVQWKKADGEIIPCIALSSIGPDRVNLLDIRTHQCIEAKKQDISKFVNKSTGPFEVSSRKLTDSDFAKHSGPVIINGDVLLYGEGEVFFPKGKLTINGGLHIGKDVPIKYLPEGLTVNGPVHIDGNYTFEEIKKDCTFEEDLYVPRCPNLSKIGGNLYVGGKAIFKGGSKRLTLPENIMVCKGIEFGFNSQKFSTS